jgi:hypothetical protein
MRNERRQRDWEKSVKRTGRVCLPQPHVQRQSLLSRTRLLQILTPDGECDVENFVLIVQDLNTIAEYFTPKQSNMQGYYLTFQLILQIKGYDKIFWVSF